jgi:hypothetical protein
MRSRADELYLQYCTPKPKRFFTLWDTQLQKPPADDSAEAEAERESIDIHIHLVV